MQTKFIADLPSFATIVKLKNGAEHGIRCHSVLVTSGDVGGEPKSIHIAPVYTDQPAIFSEAEAERFDVYAAGEWVGGWKFEDIEGNHVIQFQKFGVERHESTQQ